jgi:VIT1/CCC1 family predicted Fe2+/Mn2+ transporter
MDNFKSVQTEVDAGYLYGQLAACEADPIIAKVFAEMSDIEYGHARAFIKNIAPNSPLPEPSVRARVLNRIGKIFGYDYVLGVLMDTEKRLSAAVIEAKKQHNVELRGTETTHVQILNTLLHKQDKVSSNQFVRFEKRHRSVGGNALRAAVLGGNDGLVSNFSLVMGVAGATNGGESVLLTGIAGLLAGALSMALGEWISVKSSQELYENQMEVEMEELEVNPEGEKREIALIYIAKGIPEQQAHEMAATIMLDKQQAHQILVKEELGINADELEGSAMEAAIASFALFAVGAILPVSPYFFTTGYTAILLSTLISALGLFLIGAAITLFTGKSIWYSGFRQVLFGLTAAAITFGIGKLIGVSLAG